MKYNVFKIDDENTWPKLNCPILVWRKHHDYPYIYQWDQTAHCFLNDYDTYYPNQCLYTYVGYRPYIERETKPTKCVFDNRECPAYDDGYCIGNEKCEFQQEVTEYMIGLEPIYKEY